MSRAATSPIQRLIARSMNSASVSPCIASDTIRTVTLPFWLSDAVLITTQASLIALPAARHPAWMERLRGAAWALVPVASICIVVGVIALAPGAADVLTYMALIATPLAAALSLGY